MSMSRGGEIVDPFGAFTDLFNAGHVGGALSFPHSFSGRNVGFGDVRIDWSETAQAHVFRADLPGVKKEEVKVEVEDGRVLKISGERSEEKEEKADTWHRVERSKGKFLRRFNLPEGAKVDEVKAAMEDGVLTVTVPKVETKPSLKSIQITG